MLSSSQGIPPSLDGRSYPAGKASFPVLVVEDDPRVRKMLDITLRSLGLDVLLAASGPEAVEVFHQHHHTLSAVLLDVQMPDMDGPETLAALRAIDPNVRCCFMSGHTGKYTTGDLLALGATRVLPKPFRTIGDLQQALLETASRTLEG